MTVLLERPTVRQGATDVILRRVFPEPKPYTDDPTGWLVDRRKAELWSKQVEIAESVRDHRHTAVKSCFDSGKTFEAAALSAWWLDTHPLGDAFVITTAPSGSQVRSILWRELDRTRRAAGMPGRITWGQIPEWWIDGRQVGLGRSPTSLEDFQGYHDAFVLFVIDDAGGAEDYLFDAAAAATANVNGRVLAIGNPDDPSSRFADVCKPGSGWNVITISAFDTPAFTGEPVSESLLQKLVSTEWVEERRVAPGWGEGSPLWISRVLGEFPDVAADSLFPPRLVMRAHAAELPGLDHGSYGVDVARYGEDETVVYRNRGGVIRLVCAASQQDTEATADMVARILEMHGPDHIPAVVDAVGVGAGVFDKLRRRGLAAVEHNGGERAVDAHRFANRRAEVFWRLRELMEDGAIDLDPADELLAKQLGGIRWRESAGRIQIETKDEMRRRGVKSPDRADAVALALSGPSREAGWVEAPREEGRREWISAGLMERRW